MSSLKKIISDLSEISGYMWQRGWAERNAGNISVNLSDIESEPDTRSEASEPIGLNATYPLLDGAKLLVTATNSRMRDIHRKPRRNTLIIEILEGGSAYRRLDQGNKESNLLPTSELPTHLAIHSMIAERGSGERVVMHTHATELIALTQIREFCDQEKLNRLLWSMHPETIIFVPGGAGLVKYQAPGTDGIGRATVEALKNHSVALWEKHGVFAIGKDIGQTFDTIDLLCKAASIYFICRQSGNDPEGLTEKQLAELRKIVF